jgi:hypothetical protein
MNDYHFALVVGKVNKGKMCARDFNKRKLTIRAKKTEKCGVHIETIKL